MERANNILLRSGLVLGLPLGLALLCLDVFECFDVVRALDLVEVVDGLLAGLAELLAQQALAHLSRCGGDVTEEVTVDVTECNSG